MSIGIVNGTNVTIEQINSIVNVTNLAHLGANVNYIVYDGWMYFIILCVLCVIMFMFAQNRADDQPMTNGFVACMITSLVGLFWRGIEFTITGEIIPIITDHQFWVFPLFTALLGLLMWVTKEQ